jgi:hypothetical protein
MYTDRLAVEGGHEYQVFVYFHNNAGFAPTNPRGTAHNSTVRVHISKPANQVSISVIIKADNAEEVWDGAKFVNGTPIKVDYVANSARLFTRHADSVPIPDSTAMQPGMSIGCEKPDGIVTGDTECSGWVEFKVFVSKP